MSGHLMGQVWEIKLTHQEMLVMLALAEHGDRDGSGIYPSIARLAWMTGYTRRHIQRILRALEDKQLIIPVNAGTGGKGHTTEYVMKVSNGTKKGAYPKRDDRMPKGDILDNSPENAQRATFETPKGDILDTKGDILDTKGRHPVRPNRNRNVTKPKEETAHARGDESTPICENDVPEAEREPEADPPPLRDAPPAFGAFAASYRKRPGKGHATPYSEIRAAYWDAYGMTPEQAAELRAEQYA